MGVGGAAAQGESQGLNGNSPGTPWLSATGPEPGSQPPSAPGDNVPTQRGVIKMVC